MTTTDDLVSAALAELHGFLDDVDDETKARMIRTALYIFEARKISDESGVSAFADPSLHVARAILANDVAHAKNLATDAAWRLARKFLAIVAPVVAAKIPVLAGAVLAFLASMIQEEPEDV
jgi:Asp/Glu/hydantoin racemase